jgi:hypothetical protein
MKPRLFSIRPAAVLLWLASFLAVMADRESPAADWTDSRQLGPFICRADFSLQGIDGLWIDLAQLQGDVCQCLGIPPAQERIEIYLFHDEPAYRRYLATYFPRVPYRRALFMKLGGPGMVLTYRGKDFETTVRHECTHALLHSVLPTVPLWLDEGLAEYFQEPRAQRAYQSGHLPMTRWSARFGIAPSLEKLESKTDLPQMTSTDYRYAWAWVHFMIHGPAAAHQELAGFLDNIRTEVPYGRLSQRLAQRLGDADNSFCTHFKGWSRGS